MSLVLKEVVKRYGPQPVVDHVSLEIEEGELFVLLGASGSGKSTLLRMIAGLVPVDAGRIVLHGRDVTELPPQERKEGRHDLIVIGGHLARSWLDAPERDLTSDLVDAADRPVLVVKAAPERHPPA